jgi:TolB protein
VGTTDAGPIALAPAVGGAKANPCSSLQREDRVHGFYPPYEGPLTELQSFVMVAVVPGVLGADIIGAGIPPCSMPSEVLTEAASSFLLLLGIGLLAIGANVAEFRTAGRPCGEPLAPAAGSRCPKGPLSRQPQRRLLDQGRTGAHLQADVRHRGGMSADKEGPPMDDAITTNRLLRARRSVVIPMVTLAVIGTSVAVAAPAQAAEREAASVTNGRIAYVDETTTGRSNILTVRRDGTGVRRLTSTGDARHPQWSPDGRRLLFGRNGTRGVEVWVMSPRGRDKRLVVSAERSPRNAVWAPGGHRIAFDADAGAGTRQLFVYSLRTGQTRQVTFRGSRDWSAYDPAWSPRGGSLAFTRWSTTTELHLCTIRLDGTKLRRLTPRSSFSETDADWSPEGRTIAYNRSASLTGPTFGVYTVAAGGGTPRVVRDRDGMDAYPAWAPNGRRIIMYSSGLPGDPDFRRRAGLWTVRPDGSAARLLVQGLRKTQPDWQPQLRR